MQFFDDDFPLYRIAAHFNSDKNAISVNLQIDQSDQNFKNQCCGQTTIG